MSTAEYREVVVSNNGRYLTLGDLDDFVATARLADTPRGTVVRVKLSMLDGSALSKLILRWQESSEPAELTSDRPEEPDGPEEHRDE